ncbi:Uncharacterised protein [Klebsiella pneumoniae]|uniref:Uncharacterized protein n=1 Tax=Klebsiella pneumoniae TaxID=573 RepID=A0A377TZ12_KLEPN|nr:Uncharacterised protein [Klebsiella pneumoniae]
MTWRNEFSQECNQLRIFTASSVARTTNSLFKPVIFMFIMINADTLTKTESWRRTIGAARVDKGIINAAAGPDIPGRGRSVSPPATRSESVSKHRPGDTLRGLLLTLLDTFFDTLFDTLL